jgi:hypothetical protein
VVLALGLLAAFWDVVASDQILFFRDHCTVFRRSVQAVVGAYAEGRLPLWDPFTGGGEPLALYPNATAYSPLLAIFAIPASIDATYDLFIFLHYPIAALGTMLLLRTLGVDRSAAILGGLTFSLSGVLVSLNNLVPALASAAWAPWALAFALRVLDGRTLLDAVGLAVTLALHVSTVDPSFLVADVIIFVALVPRLPERAIRSLVVGRLVVGAGSAFLLAGIAIVPLFDLLRDTPRGTGLDYASISGFSLHPFRLGEIFFPGFGGDAIEARAVFDTGEHGRLYLGSIYVGASTIPLLALALPRTRRLMIAAVLFALFALGRFTPIHRVLVAVVPLLDSSRFPEKMTFGIALALSIAAGIGANALRTSSRDIVQRLVLFATLLLAGSAAAAQMLEHNESVTRAAAAQGLIFGAVSTAVVLAQIRGRVSSDAALSIVTFVIAIDLTLAARPLLPGGDPAILERPPIADLILRDDPHPSILLYDPLRRPGRIDHPTAEELTRFGAQRLESGIAGKLGIRSVIDLSLNAARPRFCEDAVAFFFQQREPERLRLLARWGTTHVLVEANRTNIPGLRFIGSAPVWGGHPISAFRIMGTRPFASVARAVVKANDFHSALQAMTSTAVQATVLEREVASTLDPAYLSSAVTGTVAVELDRPGEIDVEIMSDAPGLLIVAQRFDRGWRARVNGIETPPIRADAMILAVPIPAGKSEVELRFWPHSFTIGAWLSALGLAACALLCAIHFRRSRASS